MRSLLLSAAVLDFGLQLVGWAICSVAKTEKFYDMFGSATFISIMVLALVTRGAALSAKQLLLCAVVLLWALRLGSFLVVRVFKTGGDRRFDAVKTSPGKFAVYWFLQSVWVYVTLLPTLFVLNASLGGGTALAWSDSLGLSVFLLGFGMETIADLQKFKFKMAAGNEGRFISSGLWRFSRHPNYFGEMLLWWGVYVICVPSLHGAQHLACLSPLFVTSLLAFVSGIPILERQADKKWGTQQAYRDYKAKVPVLIPFLHTPGLESPTAPLEETGDMEAQAGAVAEPLEEPLNQQ